MKVNYSKTKEMILGPLAKSPPDLLSAPSSADLSSGIERVKHFKLLDVILTNDPAVFGVVEPDCPVGTSDQSLILGSVLDTNMDHCHLWVPRCSIDGTMVIMNHLSFIGWGPPFRNGAIPRGCHGYPRSPTNTYIL